MAKDQNLSIRWSAGGVGPTIMETSYLLAGTPVIAYADGQQVQAKPISQPLTVDFGKGLGRKTVWLYNLPEVESAFKYMKVPNVSARFGTDPGELKGKDILLTAVVALLEIPCYCHCSPAADAERVFLFCLITLCTAMMRHAVDCILAALVWGFMHASCKKLRHSCGVPCCHHTCCDACWRFRITWLIYNNSM